ncbi:hypothetical protein J6590_065744 [Homalodisca vitripennis]|nr:hypothetical protein J6590_065744 [Homalodisca vitripennis]
MLSSDGLSTFIIFCSINSCLGSDRVKKGQHVSCILSSAETNEGASVRETTVVTVAAGTNDRDVTCALVHTAEYVILYLPTPGGKQHLLECVFRSPLQLSPKNARPAAAVCAVLYSYRRRYKLNIGPSLSLHSTDSCLRERHGRGRVVAPRVTRYSQPDPRPYKECQRSPVCAESIGVKRFVTSISKYYHNSTRDGENGRDYSGCVFIRFSPSRMTMEDFTISNKLSRN